MIYVHAYCFRIRQVLILIEQHLIANIARSKEVCRGVLQPKPQRIDGFEQFHERLFDLSSGREYNFQFHIHILMPASTAHDGGGTQIHAVKRWGGLHFSPGFFFSALGVLHTSAKCTSPQPSAMYLQNSSVPAIGSVWWSGGFRSKWRGTPVGVALPKPRRVATRHDSGTKAKAVFFSSIIFLWHAQR